MPGIDDIEWIANYVEFRFPIRPDRMWNKFDTMSQTFPVREVFNRDRVRFEVAMHGAIREGKIIELHMEKSDGVQETFYIPGPAMGWTLTFPKRPNRGNE